MESNRAQGRPRSRSRSRDKEDRKFKLRALITEESADMARSTAWTLLDTQLLGEMIGEGLTDNEIQRDFKSRRVSTRGHDHENRPQLTYQEYMQKEEEFHNQQELIRAFMRMEQGRELPIDKYIKIVYIYKGKFKMDKSQATLRVMKLPKVYLEQQTVDELRAMIPEAEIHARTDRRNKTQYNEYWNALLELIREEIESKQHSEQTINPELQEKINRILSKQLSDLVKLEQSILASQKQNPSASDDSSFWDSILKRIKIRKLENVLVQFYHRWLETQKEEESSDDMEQKKVNTSPILMPKDFVAAKFLTTEDIENLERKKLAERIFKEDFERGRQKLQDNLSLPKNHNLLLETNIITDVNTTYDYIAEEIMEFERYKRLQEDEEDFNDWLPVETEGRFRDRKPLYVNRVRMAFQWNRYNQMHYDNQHPPPKMVQGYKFNVFYPHLLDKTKTPQYHLVPTESHQYAIITFKAGPPYEDLAFKIVNKEWDFSQKSGFQSIFAKGILHLYFNFKKPRYRI